MPYNAFAAFYDSLTGNVSYGERAAYFDAIIKQNMDSASVIADLACGTGSLSFDGHHHRRAKGDRAAGA